MMTSFKSGTQMLVAALVAFLWLLSAAHAHAAVTLTVTNVHTDARQVDFLVTTDLGPGRLRLSRDGQTVDVRQILATGTVNNLVTLSSPAASSGFTAGFLPDGATIEATSPVVTITASEHVPKASTLKLKTDQVMYPDGRIVFRGGDGSEAVYLKLNGKIVKKVDAPAGASGSFTGRLSLWRGKNYLATVSTNVWGSRSEATRRVNFIGKIPAARSFIVIDKSEFRLYLVKNLLLERRYSVAIGTWVTPTKAGRRILGAKQKSPSRAWGPLRLPLYKRTAKGLRATGYYIHGTDRPASIGTSASHGCIRMYSWEVKKLAKLARPGLKVLIRE